MVARAACELAAVSLALRIVAFTRLKRFCERVEPRYPFAPDSLIPQVSYSVNAASKLIPGAACLARALVCQHMLGSAGVATELKIGVSKKTALDAHAWLEYEGTVIMGNSSELATYSRL